MGTKVQYKSYLPGHHPAGDLNDDSNSVTCHVYYGDQPPSNSQFHDSYSKRTIGDAYFGYHTEFVKQKILDHEATFKAQLYDLHRIYRVQRDLMDELKMNELHKQSMALETSMSSCSASQRRPKDSKLEILESRPSKIRRKFDHELRADEYIDLEEPKYHSNKPPGNSSYLSNGSCNNLPSSRTNIFLGGSIKIDSGGAGARLNNGENGLADVNEKIQLQEPNSSSLNLVRYDSNILSIQPSKSQVQTFLGEFMQNSHHVREDSKSRNLTMAQKENRKEWSHMLDSGSNGQTTSFSQTLPSEKFNLYNKGHDALLFPTGHINAEYWKDRSEGVPKHSGIGIDLFNRFVNPHQSDKSSSTLKAPWEKSSNCVTPKSAAAEMHPCFNSTVTMPQSLQSSGKTAYQNGFYNGSSYTGSGPASCPEADSNYLKHSNGSDVASGLTFCPNGSINLKGLSSVDASSENGIDMNIVSIDDRHDSVNRPNRGHVADLPWLKCSMGLRNVIIQPSNSCVTRQINGPGSSGYDMAAKQIIGVPILGESHQSKVFSLCCSALSIEKETDKNGRLRGFDMNLPYKSEENDDKETHVVSGRNLIDLNMCLIEDDAVAVTTSTPGSHLEKRTIRGFYLEAPGDFEEEDLIQFKLQKPENSDEDLVTVAAEAIVGIGKLALTDTPAINPPEATTNALKWFVDEISSCLDDADKVLEDKSGDSMEEANSVDCFEYMTLQLSETKEDEYLPDYPKPPKPEEFIGSGPFTTRTRKGQARRGRPGRDFQRDILPGLTSLARHEVTEDLQTFGGLMRAMGHSWPSAFTRDRPRRGRPRLTPFQPP